MKNKRDLDDSRLLVNQAGRPDIVILGLDLIPLKQTFHDGYIGRGNDVNINFSSLISTSLVNFTQRATKETIEI